jgi:hypothetical protein
MGVSLGIYLRLCVTACRTQSQRDNVAAALPTAREGAKVIQ